MTKRMIATFMALLMALLTPLMVYAEEEVAESSAVFEEVQEEDVAVEVLSYEESRVEEDVNGTLNGFRYFTDSYNGITITGDDGKTVLSVNEGTKQLTDTLVAGNAFIQRKDPNTVYIIFVNGAVYWYNYKYQGLTGNIQKLGIKVNSFDYDGNSTGFVTENGTVPFLTESEVKEKLGISDSGKDDSSSSSGKDDSSSSEKKDDSSSSGKDDSSSSGKKDDSSSSGKKDDSSSSEKKDDSSSSEKKDDSSSSGKDDSSSSATITIKDVVTGYSFVDVIALINGKEVTYRLNTGDLGEIQQAGITANGLVYILFKNGKLILWHPSMLKDLNQQTVSAGELYVLTDNCGEIGKGLDGKIVFYDKNGNIITIPTITEIKNTNLVINVNMWDCYVDNSITNGYGNKTWTLLQRVNNKYYVVKNADSNVECKFEYIKRNRILYNGKKYKCNAASWSAAGDLFIRCKKRVYVIRNAKGTTKNKKMRFARRTKELHIDPQTNLADYVVLRNGDKVSCVTGKKIN